MVDRRHKEVPTSHCDVGAAKLEETAGCFGLAARVEQFPYVFQVGFECGTKRSMEQVLDCERFREERAGVLSLSDRLGTKPPP